MTENNSKSSIKANGDNVVEVETKVNTVEEDEQIQCEEEKIARAEQDGPPIDRGWAWVVLGACVYEIVIYGGMMRSFGVFFLQYQMRFKSSASETAIMSMIQNIVLSTSALFVMTIGLQKFSSRVSVLMGGTVTVAGYLITAFTTDIRVFYFAQGVLGGIGLAFIHPPMLAVIGVYFNKHRGLANSIFTGGGSVGGLIFAPIVVKMFEEYKYTGALLIVSGLLMNIWVAALLMRPIESYTKKKTKYIHEETDKDDEEKILLRDINQQDNDKQNPKEISQIIVESDIFKTPSNPLITKRHDPFTRMHSFDPDTTHAKLQSSPLLQRARAHSLGLRRQRTISEDNNRYESDRNIHQNDHSAGVIKGVLNVISRSQVALYTSSEGMCGSFIDVNIPLSKQASTDTVNLKNEDENEESVPQGCCLKMKSCICSVLCTVFDLSLLRNPVFLTFLLMAFSIMSGVALLPVFIPTHAKDIGISNEKIGLLISIMAVIDLVSKITMGVVADRKWVERTTILFVVSIVLGTTSHLLRFINSFPALVGLVIVSGLCCGQYFSMYAVVLMEVIGPEKFKSSLGFGTLVHGTSIAVFFPIAGLLRDKTGSYIASFHLLGGLAYLAGFLVFIIPIVNKWKKKKEKQASEDLCDKT